MEFSFLHNHSLFTFSHIICIIGLILSETHILINISIESSLFQVPSFTLIYYTISTVALLGLVIRYTFFKGTNAALAIQFFQHIGIGLSVILYRFLLGHNGLDSFVKIACLFLLILQCVLVSIKIIYLGSVTKELSQISGLTKLSRILKLLLTAIIPQFTSSEFPLVIVLSVCELLTIFMFLFKYTYQKVSVQYLLLIGVFGGFISSLEDILCNIFEYDYYYLGECFIIIIFVIPHTPLHSFLEIKYCLLFTGLSENKSEDQHLAQILFLRECIFEKHQSLAISQAAKNDAILQISHMIERTKKITTKENYNNGELQQGSYLFLQEIQKGGVQLQGSFFQILLNRFKQTSNFQTFSFLIDCALEMPKKYSVFALILYYGFRERTMLKRSSLEQCRYEIIYRLLVSQFCSQYRDKQQISFLQFSNNCQKLYELIENCLNDEIELIQSLSNDEKRSEMFVDSNLLKQFATKQKIRNMFEMCFKSKLYLFSNEFKYIYLLYNTAIQKKYSQLKKDLRHRFLSVEAKSIKATYYPRYLIVLSGFSSGDIVQSNQTFKNYFKFINNNQNKSTISQLFPNDKQKRRHNSLMLQYSQQVCDRQGDHSKYECLIAVQTEVNSFKIKVLERFKITARVYCENQNGFNYVCEMIKLYEKNEDVVTILKKERDIFEKKGLQLITKNIRIFNQLEDEFEICDIEGDFRNQEFASISKIQNKAQQFYLQPQVEDNNPETSLNEKITLIEQKMIEQKRLKKTNMVSIWILVQLIIIILLSVFIGVTYLKLQSEVSSLNFVLTVEIKAIRQANLIRNRIMVQKLILNLVKGTNYFPDSICSSSKIKNLTQYFTEYMYDDMTDNFDDFIDILLSPNLQQNLLAKVFNNRYSATPYLYNYQNNITFQKYLYLLKSKEIYWLGQLQNGSKISFDQRYYSLIFPNQLLSYSISSNSSLYSLNNLISDSYYSDLLSTTNELKIIFLIVNVALMLILLTFRIKDTIPLIEILAAFEGINNKILIPKLKELKYSLSMLRKIKTTRIMSLEIDTDTFVTIENDKQIAQTKMVQNFTKQQKQFYKNVDDDGYNQRQEQNSTLLKYSEMQSSRTLPNSTILRSLIYNKCYLLMLVVMMGSIIASCALFINGFANQITALQNYQDTDAQLALLNQKYINIVAYNWLKAYSLTSKTFNMTSVSILFNNSLQTFKGMNFQKLFYKNYPGNLANQILYGNPCKYFLNPNHCSDYRSGSLTEGISVILPFTIKEQIEGKDVSSTDYNYYTPSLCDKTYILFEGVIPLNRKIPAYGLKTVLGDNDMYLLFQATLTLTIVGFLFIMTIMWQVVRKQKQQKIREEVLSLDTVSNLYHISDLKPYFNKIYYA